ncbi:MAG: amidohydrolase family protein [Chitinophagaceae bacterium]
MIISNIAVVDVVNGTITNNQHILIDGKKIVKVSANRIRRKGCLMINGKGKFIMPGLADMHAHLPNADEQHFKKEEYLFLFVANGVTTIRSMRGYSDQLTWRDSITQSKWIGPNLLLGSPVVYDEDSVFNRDKWVEFINLHAAKYDFIKYLHCRSTQNFDSICNLLPSSTMISGHCPPGGIEQAIKRKMRSVEHIEFIIDALKEDSLSFKRKIQGLATGDLFFCPDLYWYYITFDQYDLATLNKKDYIKYVTKTERERWTQELGQYYRSDVQKNYAQFLKDKSDNSYWLQSVKRHLKWMSMQGVQLLISPAAGYYNVPGFSMYDEILLFKDAGLTNAEILKCATYNAAVCMKQEDSWGTVFENKRADMIILNKNPLTDISALRSIYGVFYNGKYISNISIKKKLKQIEEDNK